MNKNKSKKSRFNRLAAKLFKKFGNKSQAKHWQKNEYDAIKEHMKSSSSDLEAWARSSDGFNAKVAKSLISSRKSFSRRVRNKRN